MIKYFRINFIVLFFLFIFSNSVIAEEVLTWRECIKEAAKNNPDLIAASEEIKQSVAGKDITASALFPQIDASLSASTAKSATSAKGSTTDSYSYGVTGTQLIFDGTKTIQNIKADLETIKASKQNFRFTSATVRYRLRRAFVNLLTAQESLNITQQIYNIRRSNLELITLRYESGLEHKGALLTAEADLAGAIYDINQAKRSLEVAQRELTKEMGRKELIPMKVSGSFEVTSIEKEKPDFEALVKNNPSLLQAAATKSAAQFSLKSAYANFSPTLSGEAGANKTSSHWPPNDDLWNAGLTLSMPIFEGGLRLAQVSQAKALLSQLIENERSTKDSLTLSLEQTWAILEDALGNLEVQGKVLEATAERSKIAQAQYSIGFITFDNWTIIEDNLVKAKRTFLDAQASTLLAQADWVRAKGETLEYE